MKKLLCLILALCTVLSLSLLFTSCGEEEETLKMVTNAYFAPYEYFEGEKIVGIDAEIAEAIGKKIGKKVVIESINFDSIISSVNAGDADFGMAGITVTEERLEEVDFTKSYATGCQMLVVKKDSAFNSLDDLVAYPYDEEKKEFITEGNTATEIGVQLGTTGALYAEWDGYNAVPYTTANEAILALKNGDVDCVMIDSAPAQNFVDNNTDLRMIDGSEAYIVEEYAICVKKGNTELLNELNAAIDALMQDGTINGIIEKYIPAK
ncbi:MAG: transporter substrate-binding domain-containing protein [Clostridia bacterium]|nr:transporter substrate-binding domain-containing protein [Clostridia bacterium]